MVEPQPENYSVSAEPPVLHTDVVPNHLAVHPRSSEAGPAGDESRSSAPVGQDFQQLLQPILQGVEALAKGQFAQAGVLERVEEAMMHQTTVPKVLSEAKQALEQRNLVNRAMFEALHAELKTYKDGFLLEAVLRPVIRDLISLYDDIFEIHRQLALALSSHEQRGGLVGSALILFENVAARANQLEHNRDAILEVLERLDVVLLPPGSGKLNKQVQRAVSIEIADDADQDQEIVKVVKRGFSWKERVIRPEEVIIKRWKAAMPATAAKASSQA